MPHTNTMVKILLILSRTKERKDILNTKEFHSMQKQHQHAKLGYNGLARCRVTMLDFFFKTAWNLTAIHDLIMNWIMKVLYNHLRHSNITKLIQISKGKKSDTNHFMHLWIWLDYWGICSSKKWVASRSKPYTLLYCFLCILFFTSLFINKARHTEPMCSKAVKPTWLLDSLGREMVTFTWKYLHCSKVRICEWRALSTLTGKRMRQSKVFLNN